MKPMTEKESSAAEYWSTALVYATLLMLLYMFIGVSFLALDSYPTHDYFTIIMGIILSLGILEAYVRFRMRKD